MLDLVPTDHERAALPRHAPRVESAFQGLGDPPRDGQAEPDAGVTSATGVRRAVEWLEDSGDVVGGDPPAGILDREARKSPLASDPDDDGAAGRAIFAGIVEEIVEELAQQPRMRGSSGRPRSRPQGGCRPSEGGPRVRLGVRRPSGRGPSGCPRACPRRPRCGPKRGGPRRSRRAGPPALRPIRGPCDTPRPVARASGRPRPGRSSRSMGSAIDARRRRRSVAGGGRPGAGGPGGH